jgi:hypothetical protein
MQFIQIQNLDTDIKNNNMKTIELKSTTQFIKILTIITLTYLALNLSNQIQLNPVVNFSNSNYDTLVTYK